MHVSEWLQFYECTLRRNFACLLIVDLFIHTYVHTYMYMLGYSFWNSMNIKKVSNINHLLNTH